MSKELYDIPLDPMQYGLLEVALRNLGTERAIEIRSQIERQVFREGLVPIVVSVNRDEYNEMSHAICELALHSGVEGEAGDLIRHMKYFTRRTDESGFYWNPNLQ
ncbi:hypothetical protein M199_gp213 [Halogranum tailed virus 1]|uniref:Uncharacterized protein n=1 Tax=Halogranum tailed virus 1 TaxID=1273749 RepID=R4TMQ2_9CAUD|nr:hypothetical protein M199_gp213 [Halogranum tailed virus 1]AGM11453.1 hypothetical protein HGTV1_156 [Halogranum tailed virus 1]